MDAETMRSLRSNSARHLKNLMTAVVALLTAAATLFVPWGTPAGADGGDIQSINFAAEDPEEYDHATGGGAFGSDTDGDGKDTVESLQGGDFACGDLVTFFVELIAQGDGTDDAQTIQMTNTFLADATGQTGAGLTDVVNLLIDPSDPAQSNDGGSTVTVIDEGIDANGAAPYANDGQKLSGGGDSTYVTYQVDDLESGETVVVRIDVRIECAAGTSPTGNLQGNLTEAHIVAINDGNLLPTPDAVAGGNQTIPFQKLGELVGGGEPLLGIEKTVMAAGGTCGVDDVELLDVSVGDTVTFCYVVSNDGTADLENASIVDDNGTLDTSDDFAIAVGTVAALSSTTVQTDVVIGSAGTITNTATATGDGPRNTTLTETDTAVVESTIALLPPVASLIKGNEAGDHVVGSVAEPGGSIVIPVSVTNSGGDAELTSLIDVPHGDITQVQGDVVATTCSVPQALAEGESYSCEFTTSFNGGAGDSLTDQLTATLTNAAGSSTADDQATVTVLDVPSSILVSKVADPVSVDEPGGVVTFSFVVENTSLVDSVTVESLVDSIYGDLDGVGDCSVPQVLVPGGSYSCEIAESVSGGAGEVVTNVVTVGAVDDDGQLLSGEAEATVTIVDVLPEVSVVKSADPVSVDEPGGDVEFTVVVTNDSVEDVTIDSLSDSDFDLVVLCADAVGVVLAAGASYECVFTVFVAGNSVDGGHENTVTVSVSDDEGNSGSASDDAGVEVVDVPPSITVTKTPNQDVVFAPGEDVTFTIGVTNDSASSDPVTVNSLIDDVFGDLSAECALPVTLGSGATLECDIVRTISADHTNTVSVSGSDDEGTLVSGEASASVDAVDPSLSIEKLTNGVDDLSILEGEEVTWTYTVTNDGDVALTDVVVVDDQNVVVICDATELPVGGSINCSATGTAIAGEYTNTGTATGSFTDDEGDTATPSDSDQSNYFGVSPSVAITKTFADDSVSAGATGSFDLVVTNDGNVTLTDVLVGDAVDGSLLVSGVSAGTGSDADTDGDEQSVEWVIPSLDAGESVTVTVSFTVDSTAPETLGVVNDATVESVYVDDSGNTVPVDDEASDTIDILVDVNLSLAKSFTPDGVSQGTIQSFTLVVANDGPSDAIDVSVTDVVDAALDVRGVETTSGIGDCSASSGQNVDCTVQIPAGESVTITVAYVAAPFFDEVSPYGTVSGDDFRFVFVNGSVLEGSTDGGPVFFDGVEITSDVTLVKGLTKNEITFDPPGPAPAFTLHLSCSDPFTNGWGEAGGPVEGLDVDWQIAFFSIARYQNGDFRKSCGGVANAFDIDNVGTASAIDSFGTDTANGGDTLTVEPGITIDSLQANGKRLTVRLTNATGVGKTIEDISFVWPSSNGQLRRVRLDAATVWLGKENPTSVLLDGSDPAWSGGTLAPGDAILRFDFQKKSAKSGYTIRVNFTDGTFLDIAS